MIKLLIAIGLTSTFPMFGGGVPRQECFPFEQLPPDLRTLAEQTLLDALDTEALFTLVTGLKPMSQALLTEERRFTLSTEHPQVSELDRYRNIAEYWRCAGEIQVEITPLKYVTNTSQDALVKASPGQRAQGSRTVYGNVIHLPSMAHVIEQHPDIYSYHGLTKLSHSAEVITRLEMLETIDRDLGFGYLYGYPAHAVAFYAKLLDRKQPLQKGEAVNINIPVFRWQRENLSQFRYRQSPDHQENLEDKKLKSKAARILDSYQTRRAQYIGSGKRGVLALIRDWYDDGMGLCSPSNVKLNP